MAKLKISKAQVTFPLEVDIPTPNGDDQVNFTAKHLKASEWSKLRESHTETVNAAVKALFDAAQKAAEDEYTTAAKDGKPATEDEKTAAIALLVKPIKQSVLDELKSKHAAELIAKVLISWDLDDEYSVKALVEMCDLYPAASNAIFTKYNSALEGSRLGN
jgi:hypothetical protein